MACWSRPDIRRSGRGHDRDSVVPAFAGRPPAARVLRKRLSRVPARRLSARLVHAAALARRHLVRVPGLRVMARHRRVAEAGSRFIDYGPEWPPVAAASRAPHGLLRRCVTVVVVYAVIWGLGSVLLEVRLLQLRGVAGGVPVTTYTTVTGPAPR